MATDVKLPELGDGIESGDVLHVLVQVGDEIRKNQAIVELETDKATVEVPSSHAGRVTKVHVSVGQSIPIGGVLISVEASAPASQPKSDPVPPSSASEKSAQPPPAAEKTGAEKTGAEKPAAEEPATESPKTPSKKPASQPPQPVAQQARKVAVPDESDEIESEVAANAESPDGDVIAAGPAVRRFAREVGVDLRQVTGSGPGGRIQREDVLAVVRHASEAVRSGRAKAGGKSGKPEQRDDWGPIRVERMTKIRKTIAQRMHDSWSNIPRVTNFDDADVTELEKIRQASKDDYAARGTKLTSMPFVIKACAMALRAHPAINAAVDMEQAQIIYKEYINIGIAVDTDRGLVVPSLRGADKMSIPDVARGLASIAEAARNGTFTLEDLRGGTFTISNLGAIGGTYSTPIINLPEVAILLVGRTRPMPVVFHDKIVSRLMMPLSLSYDHRLVDGATAARFLNDVIGYLRAPSRLLLAP